MSTYRVEGDLTLIVYARKNIEAGEGVCSVWNRVAETGDLGQCTT